MISSQTQTSNIKKEEDAVKLSDISETCTQKSPKEKPFRYLFIYLWSPRRIIRHTIIRSHTPKKSKRVKLIILLIEKLNLKKLLHPSYSYRIANETNHIHYVSFFVMSSTRTFYQNTLKINIFSAFIWNTYLNTHTHTQKWLLCTQKRTKNLYWCHALQISTQIKNNNKKNWIFLINKERKGYFISTLKHLICFFHGWWWWSEYVNWKHKKKILKYIFVFLNFSTRIVA